MAKKVTISVSLPKEVYDELSREAHGRGERLKAIILRRLKGVKRRKPRRTVGISPELRKYFGAFKGSDPRGSDNGKIDADIARELMDDHEPRGR